MGPTIIFRTDISFRFASHFSVLNSLIMRRSDKWLRQAGIVDEDFITTTDTAILFRKMSRFALLS